MSDAIKKITLETWFEVIESLRKLSHQVEQKNYMLVQHNQSIQNLARGIQDFQTDHDDYSQKQKHVTAQIEHLKSLVDLD